MYRADFRITLAELEAPTGEWKFTLGMLLAFMGGSIWLYSLIRNLSKSPTPPHLYPISETKWLILNLFILSLISSLQLSKTSWHFAREPGQEARENDCPGSRQNPRHLIQMGLREGRLEEISGWLFFVPVSWKRKSYTNFIITIHHHHHHHPASSSTTTIINFYRDNQQLGKQHQKEELMQH